MKKKKINKSFILAVYDILLILVADALLFGLYGGLISALQPTEIAVNIILSCLCIMISRILFRIYDQVWRYGGVQCYIRLLVSDICAFAAAFILERCSVAFFDLKPTSFELLLAASCVNFIAALAIRLIYRYAYKCVGTDTWYKKLSIKLLALFSGTDDASNHASDSVNGEKAVNIAIIGAGRVGVTLAEELLANKSTAYHPVCFIDASPDKVGREIHSIPVLPENDSTVSMLEKHEVREVVLAIPCLNDTEKKRLVDKYFSAGYRLKTYDYPIMETADKKRSLREFDIEELLFRKPISISNDKTSAYYKDKVILITGGGGSIGSELCRQLAKMSPKKIVILDIYENGAYDVQQELKIAYGKSLDLCVEICSITNRAAMARVFEAYHPNIVINAAAHKHVPLMEHNCVEAVENNVFGTRNLVELCEQYNVGRFMMVSTDKAVNPTNVMGATKRMCEMIVQSASSYGNVKYSATRFGNVLGSAGSVIPLFKKQIANGGPITLTDKRIIRYFMTIPEASQLVLQSGAMAKNGELFVLDMGEPVEIYALARNMIRLSGARDIEIIETGLRPGEKLYEELLVKTEELDKTENSLIFIEKDQPLSREDIDDRLEKLRVACESGDDELVRSTLKQVVPTFRSPEEVNAKASDAEEMKKKKNLVTA